MVWLTPGHTLSSIFNRKFRLWATHTLDHTRRSLLRGTGEKLHFYMRNHRCWPAAVGLAVREKEEEEEEKKKKEQEGNEVSSPIHVELSDEEASV